MKKINLKFIMENKLLENQKLILEELKNIKKEISEMKKDTKRMDDHISFIETVYERIKNPLYFITDKINSRLITNES